MKTSEKNLPLLSVVEKCRVLTEGVGPFPKGNGSMVMLYNVEITSGPNTGKKYTADWFILNQAGQEKAPLKIGEELTAYIDIYASTVEGRNYTTFITLGKNSDTSNNDDDSALAWLNSGI